jgi:predicted transcriptional regulator
VTPPYDHPPARETKLQRFMQGEGITAAAIEKNANISRPSFYRIRKGQDVRLSTMLRVLRAVRVALGRRVKMDEIFELDPE